MKTLLSLFILLCFAVPGSAQGIKSLQKASDKAQQIMKPKNEILIKSPVSLVNPFVGTGGHGHTFPGATAPFGMIQLSPDTRHEGWDGCSGYHYSDSVIYGFSHTHLSGTGVPDYCDLLIVPQSGKKAKVVPGYENEKGFGSKFSHSTEKASPGYYEVFLEDDGIKAQMTTSERAGIHQYTFTREKDKKFILIDFDHRDDLIFAEYILDGKKHISGQRTSKSWADEQHFYFDLEFSTEYRLFLSKYDCRSQKLSKLVQYGRILVPKVVNENQKTYDSRNDPKRLGNGSYSFWESWEAVFV